MREHQQAAPKGNRLRPHRAGSPVGAYPLEVAGGARRNKRLLFPALSVHSARKVPPPPTIQGFRRLGGGPIQQVSEEERTPAPGALGGGRREGRLRTAPRGAPCQAASPSGACCGTCCSPRLPPPRKNPRPWSRASLLPKGTCRQTPLLTTPRGTFPHRHTYTHTHLPAPEEPVMRFFSPVASSVGVAG